MTFSFADAVHRHYSVIKVFLYYLLDIHTKNEVILSVWKKKHLFASFFFKRLLQYLFKQLDVQPGKIYINDIKVVSNFLSFCLCCCEPFYEIRQNLSNSKRYVLNTISVYPYSSLRHTATYSTEFPCSIILQYVNLYRLYFLIIPQSARNFKFIEMIRRDIIINVDRAQ